MMRPARSRDIDARNAIPFRSGEIGKRTGRNEAGRVDEDVQPSCRLLDLRKGGEDRRRVGHVHDQGGCGVPVERQRRRGACCGGAVAVGKPYRTPFTRKGAGNGLTNARARAGDRGNATFQIEVHAGARLRIRNDSSCLLSGLQPRHNIVRRHIALVHVAHGEH